MASTIHALVPLLCVVAAAIAAMVAEAFRTPGERMPIAPLGIIGLVRRGVPPPISSGITGPRASASCRPTTTALFITWTLIIVGILSLALSVPVVERKGCRRASTTR